MRLALCTLASTQTRLQLVGWWVLFAFWVVVVKLTVGLGFRVVVVAFTVLVGGGGGGLVGGLVGGWVGGWVGGLVGACVGGAG